ncbi:hypothetical protein NORO109296_22755 [Nocardiopsis rhodophaea]
MEGVGVSVDNAAAKMIHSPVEIPFAMVFHVFHLLLIVDFRCNDGFRAPCPSSVSSFGRGAEKSAARGARHPSSGSVCPSVVRLGFWSQIPRSHGFSSVAGEIGAPYVGRGQSIGHPPVVAGFRGTRGYVSLGCRRRVNRYYLLLA